MPVSTRNLTVHTLNLLDAALPEVNITLQLSKADTDADGTVLPVQSITATADALGVAVIPLWPNARGTRGSVYSIVMRTPDNSRVVFRGRFAMPDYDSSLDSLLAAGAVPASSQALFLNAVNTLLGPMLKMMGDFDVTVGAGLPAASNNEAYRLTNVPAVGAPSVDGKPVVSGMVVYFHDSAWHVMGGGGFSIDDWNGDALTPDLPVGTAKDAILCVTSIANGASLVLDGKTFKVGDLAVVLEVDPVISLVRIPSEGVTPAEATAIATALDNALGAQFMLLFGAANGLAELDAFGRLKQNVDASKITTGVIDAARLPSYVDDVIERADFATMDAIPGETGKIYITLDDDHQFRWTGSAYVDITGGLGPIAAASLLGNDTAGTAVPTALGKAAVQSLLDVAWLLQSVTTGYGLKVHALTAAGADADIAVALVPKGDGSLLAQKPTGTSAGGMARGAQCVDWQMARGAAIRVAGGIWGTIGGGYGNGIDTTGTGSLYAGTVAGGYNNIVYQQSYGTISGGLNGQVAATAGFIGAGNANAVYSDNAGVLCGDHNAQYGANGAILSGSYCVNEGSNSVIIGGGVSITNYADYAQADVGPGSIRIRNHAEKARGIARSVSTGSPAVGKLSSIPLVERTTDATPTKLETSKTTGPSGDYIHVDEDVATHARTFIIGRARIIGDNLGGDVFMTEIQFMLMRTAVNNLAQVGATVVVSSYSSAGAAGWAADVAVQPTADSGRGTFTIEVIGDAADAVHWTADIDMHTHWS